MADSEKQNKENIPNCVGIIMDGNRRWAKENGMPVLSGHKAGYDKLVELLRWMKEKGVRNAVAYAFSTENWKRAKEEIDMLLRLFSNAINSEQETIKKEKVRIKFVGQTERFSKDIQEGIKKIEEETKDFKDHTLAIAVSYGGRAEIVEAVRKIMNKVDVKDTESITEDEFEKYLWTYGIPDPDLIIRTGGEVRTSNFLPWQSVYSELFFTDTYWPAFTKDEFKKILEEFATRERRRGK